MEHKKKKFLQFFWKIPFAKNYLSEGSGKKKTVGKEK